MVKAPETPRGIPDMLILRATDGTVHARTASPTTSPQTHSDAALPSVLTGYDMGGNAFENNIVYFSSTVSNSLWVVRIGSSDALPAVATNLYYSVTDASISNSGQIVDGNPVYADPQFTNPSGGDYSM